KIVFDLLIAIPVILLVAADTIYLRSGMTVRGNVPGYINGRFAIQLTAPATLPVQTGNRPSNSSSTETSYSQTRTVPAGSVIFLRPRDIDRKLWMCRLVQTGSTVASICGAANASGLTRPARSTRDARASRLPVCPP